MARIRYNKTELKRQRDMLDNYTRFLPLLRMKKQQLQLEMRMIENQQALLEKELNKLLGKFERWAELLNARPNITGFLSLALEITDYNIAGVKIPKIKSVIFKEREYDLFEMPPWVELVLTELKNMKKVKEEFKICEKQKEILAEELKIVSRRVNLFEKVFIPKTADAIRLINIYLEERQKETVIRSKKCKEIVNKRKRL
ncbi:MAG: V-type ATP synthase subunit D [Candidatus Loosdrechtia sp.]|uniref:V-type ATP synthase subunit D n=1 Tax=Candidatus Loosdrechtia sp. TaxID=3101272 RepID=UPI003A6ACE32|nr:MAG: V-type ATP synthase subunit D [Candidatus Jettenia sp. AMX2]